MKKDFLIDRKYLLIPVCVEKELKTVSFLLGKEKLYEFRIPVGEGSPYYAYHFMAPIDVHRYLGKKITIEGEVPSRFLDAITTSSDRPENKQARPLIHYTPNMGWMNDPNGLLYQNGIYHMYFQHNLFDTRWENMSWGHAVSNDLLHWEQLDTALYPDHEGSVFSGSAIINKRGLLGLPETAQLYFYTSAGDTSEWSRGKLTTQRMAVSTDGGRTLIRQEGNVVNHIVKQNRDPKVYWHEESKGYYMVLYLDGDEYTILRSVDLKNWRRTQTIRLEGVWECPDLRRVPVEGGGYKWVFWTADGYYYIGEFNGSEFKTDGHRHTAYLTKLPYAAQTFYGTRDIISIPWLRTKNAGKLYTGSMGIPRKMTLVKEGEDYRVRLAYVEQYQRARKNVFHSHSERKIYFTIQKDAALEIDICMDKTEDFVINLYGSAISYVASCGKLSVGDETVDIGKNKKDFSILADGQVVEISLDHGLGLAVMELESDRMKGMVTVEVSGRANVDICRIR